MSDGSAQLVVVDDLDRETTDFYSITVVARDGGEQKPIIIISFTIHVVTLWVQNETDFIIVKISTCALACDRNIFE